MKTIARNRQKFIADLFARAKSCKVYTLDNGFEPLYCEPNVALHDLYVYPFSKLKLWDDGTYQVRVHSNHWYKLEV